MANKKRNFKKFVLIFFILLLISTPLVFMNVITLLSNKIVLLLLTMGCSAKLTFYLKNLSELSILFISWVVLIYIYLYATRLIWGDQLKGLHMNLRKRIIDRFLVEIIVKHKKQLIEEQIDKNQMQKDINNIINNFIKKTGREVEQIEVERQGDKYKLKLRVM